MKKKGTTSVEEAVEEAFEMLPRHFNINDLIHNTRMVMERPYLHDSTILRRMRDLRRDYKIHYTVIDQSKGKYEKNVKVSSTK